MISTRHTLAVAASAGRSAGRKLATLFAALTVLAALAIPVSAEPQGYMAEDFGVGYFYGTFDQNPNVVLLAGGRAEEFCELAAAEAKEAGEEGPGNPFFAEPGTTDSREFLRDDGSLDIHVNAKHQEIYLYETAEADDGNTPAEDGEAWILRVCSELYYTETPVPEPFAEGLADLKVRISFVFLGGPPEHVFNSVNGKATGVDGTEYKVRAWAEVPFEDGAPVGVPSDWVGFELREIKR